MADPDLGDHLASLVHRLDVPGLGPAALARALTHRSWCAEHPDVPSNERLEFLGDAVLGLAVTEHLYEAHPGMPEGELAKTRAAVVSAAALAEVARRLDVGAALRLGRGEEATGGRDKRSILADAMEAVFGVVHLEAGYQAAHDLVLRLLHDDIAVAVEGPGGEDHKTRFQEVAAHRWAAVPVYVLDERGPDHAKQFTATVAVDGQILGTGEGLSKKEAEQAAARAALTRLESGADEGVVTTTPEEGEVHA